MKPVTVSTEVNADQQTVYEFLSVLGAHERFTAPMLVDYHPSGPERGVGAQVRLTAVMGKRREPVDITVIEDDAPSRIAEFNISSRGRRRATGTYELEARPGNRTQVTFIYAWQHLPFVERLFGPLVRSAMRRALDTTMTNLAAQFANAKTASDAV